MEAPGTPLSERLYPVMSQSLADITGTALAQRQGQSGAEMGSLSPGGGPSEAAWLHRTRQALVGAAWEVPGLWWDRGCGPL